jgi:hypothetical protein
VVVARHPGQADDRGVSAEHEPDPDLPTEAATEAMAEAFTEPPTEVVATPEPPTTAFPTEPTAVFATEPPTAAFAGVESPTAVLPGNEPPAGAFGTESPTAVLPGNEPPVGAESPVGAGRDELAGARERVLAALRELDERGGPSLRPASVHAVQPLSGIGLFAGQEGLTTAERRAVSAASRWQARLNWFGSLGGSAERRLLVVACELVTGIAARPAWVAELDRPRPDLAVELDQIEQHAHDLAELRETAGETHSENVRQGWRALLDRVSALAHYADRLAALEADADLVAAQHAEELAARAATGTVENELAADHLRLLADDLRPPLGGVGRTEIGPS